MSSPEHQQTCKHEWMRGQEGEGDYCIFCGVPWVEWARGFDSNVRAFKRKPEPVIRPNV